MYEPPDVAAWNTAQKSSLSHEVLPLNQREISSGKRTFRELHGLPIHLACISLSLYFTCSLNLRTLENQDDRSINCLISSTNRKTSISLSPTGSAPCTPASWACFLHLWLYVGSFSTLREDALYSRRRYRSSAAAAAFRRPLPVLVLMFINTHCCLQSPNPSCHKHTLPQLLSPPTSSLTFTAPNNTLSLSPPFPGSAMPIFPVHISLHH